MQKKEGTVYLKAEWGDEKYNKIQDLLNSRDKEEGKADATPAPSTSAAKPKLAKHTTMVATAKV